MTACDGYNCFPLYLGAAAASVSSWVTLWLTRVCLSSNYWTDFYITCCRSLGTARASFGTDVEGELLFELQLWVKRKIKLPCLGEVRWFLQQNPPVINVFSLLGPCHTAGLPWREIRRTNLVHSTNDIVWYTCGTVLSPTFSLCFVCLTTERRPNLNKSPCECLSAGWLQHHVLASKWGYIGLPSER